MPALELPNKMKIAVMQPYFMPYLGYFQLIHAVDRFVFLDDVNFIKRGWINRNRILAQDSPQLFSIPLQNASQNRKINEIELAIDDRWTKKFFRTLATSYSKAPYYQGTSDFLSDLLNQEHENIGELCKASVRGFAQVIGLPTTFVDSSCVYENTSLAGQVRILDICQREGATTYVNPPDGRDMYDAELFDSKGVSLQFLNANLQPYRQGGVEFVPGLSAIDAMMYQSPVDLNHLVKSTVSS